MKKWKLNLLISLLVILFTVFILIACEEEKEQPIFRIEEITLTFGVNNYIANIKANLTRSDMDNLKSRFITLFNNVYPDLGGLAKAQYDAVFGRTNGITIELGNRPSENYYETVQDSNTLYLNNNAIILSDNELQIKLTSAIASMADNYNKIE